MMRRKGPQAAKGIQTIPDAAPLTLITERFPTVPSRKGLAPLKGEKQETVLIVAIELFRVWC